MKYAFIDRERVTYKVTTLCRVLEVTRQGFYAWRTRKPSRRAVRDRQLSARIRVVHAESRRTYGSPRVHAELKAQGESVSRKHVERLMREEELQAKAARKFRATTDSKHGKAVAPNLLKQNFSVDTPNRVWVGDITYLWTAEGWLYLAVFLDLYSRMVVGWALGTRLDVSLVTTAFNRACVRRRPSPGLIVHTDRGSQYASDTFATLVKDFGALQSMSRKACCWDNAPAESFFHSLKIEAIYGVRFDSRRDMEHQVFDYVERFYNKSRRHSAVGLVSPREFEEMITRKAVA